MRAVLALSAAVLLALAACTAKTSDETSTGGGDTGGTGGSGSPWGTRTDIEAIFAKDCAQCHADQWSSCWNVHQSAEAIEGAIQTDDMPRGMPMALNDKAAVLAWLNEGAPCFGPEPDGGTGFYTGGSPTPSGEGADL